MTRAAGILYLTPGRRALFLKRGPGGDHPSEWCWPGGHLEDGETAERGVLRESDEECGFAPEAARLQAHTRGVTEADAPGGEAVDFTTFLCRVPAEFAVTLCDEHTGYAWAGVDAAPEPLHPGCRVALDRLTMNELGVARAMAAGQLASPQKYHNVWLFNIRITGTGMSYRPTLEEFVQRPPEVWLTEETLARCNGLQVIWEHPKKSLLNSDEFNERTIGSVFLPYIRADEVWAVVKIYDEAAADDMAHRELSTSPAVNFAPGVNQTIVVDGRTVLLETDPALIDHIAVCPVGVWDKGGPAAGIESVELAVADSAPLAPRPINLALLGLAVAAFRLNVASRAGARRTT